MDKMASQRRTRGKHHRQRQKRQRQHHTNHGSYHPLLSPHRGIMFLFFLIYPSDDVVFKQNHTRNIAYYNAAKSDFRHFPVTLTSLTRRQILKEA
jgi:hypothetical protein